MSKKTVSIIIESGNQYIIQVKGNQKNLYKQILHITSNPKSAIDMYCHINKKRGRTESRKVFIYKDIWGISADWIGLKRIILVERSVVVKGVVSQHKAYYISSLRCNRAVIFAHYIRLHWSIENRLHWVKDVVMKEDTSRTARGSAAPSISLLRNIVINLFRSQGYASIKEATEKYRNRFDQMVDLISLKSINHKRT